MRHLGQKFLNPCYWAVLGILVFHCYCTADTVTVEDKQAQTLEHCSFKNLNEGCAADTDTRAAYTESQNQQKTQDGGDGQGEEDYQDFLHRSMERLEGMLEESRHQVMKKLRKVMDKMAHSRDHMIKKLDSLLDSVSHSRLVTEIDHLLEEVSHSKIIEDMKALPREIKESLLLSVRNRSYVAAGIMVIVTMVILVGGSLYFAWCHHDGWSITYDYKALAMGVSAVKGTAQDQDEVQADAEGFEEVRKEKVGEEGAFLQSQNSLSLDESSRDKSVSNGVGNVSKDTDKSEGGDSLSNDGKKNENGHVSNGVSATFNVLEGSRSSESKSGNYQVI